MLIQNECVHNAAMCFGSAGRTLKMSLLCRKQGVFLGKMRLIFFVVPPCFHLRVASHKVIVAFHCPILPASAFVRDDNIAVFICMQQGMDTGVQIHAAVRAIQVSHELRTFRKLLRAEGRLRSPTSLQFRGRPSADYLPGHPWKNIRTQGRQRGGDGHLCAC